MNAVDLSTSLHWVPSLYTVYIAEGETWKDNNDECLNGEAA